MKNKITILFCALILVTLMVACGKNTDEVASIDFVNLGLQEAVESIRVSVSAEEVETVLERKSEAIVNDNSEGLANSLNIGINEARGKYIARLDADDLANASRLSTQVYYMEKHPEIGFTQLYQHYFGAGANDFIHRPPISSEEIKAKLLFFCDVCHSTVMFRKEIWEANKLEYRAEHALEDYDLWCRAIKVTDFATIPEIYGEYRVGGNGITSQKVDSMKAKVFGIVAGTNTPNNTEPFMSEGFLLDNSLVSYMYSSMVNRDLWKKHNPSHNYNLYFETLTSSTEPSFKGFYPDRTGYSLKFLEKEGNEEGIKEIQQGILDFASDYIQHFKDEPLLFNISGRDAYAPMMVACSKKEKYLKELYKEFHLKLEVGA